jgi:nuclear pore complex protein Nup54
VKAELSRRVQSLQSISRAQAHSFSAGSSIYLPGSTKIDEQSLIDMQEVLQQETEAVGRLGNVLKRDLRDTEIMVAEDTEMTQDA